MLPSTRSILFSEATAACRSLARPSPYVFKRQFSGTPRHPSTQNPSSADMTGSHHDFLNFGSSTRSTPPPQRSTTTQKLLDLKQPRHVNFPISFNAQNLLQDDPAKLRATVRFQLFPECSRLVREHLGATRAVPFDWRQTAVKPDWGQTAAPPKTSLRQAVGDEDAASWMGRRWVIVTLSRPLGETAGTQTRIALEYDTQEGWWANERGASEADVVDGACSIDVRVLARLE